MTTLQGLDSEYCEIEPLLWRCSSEYGEFFYYVTNDSATHRTLEQAREHKRSLEGTEYAQTSLNDQ